MLNNEEKKNFIRILFLGDIVGSPGREILKRHLLTFRQEKQIDFVIANGENSVSGSGITPYIAKELFDSGVDVLTSGDHIWRRKEIYDFLEQTNKVLRPANYPNGVPGKGSVVINATNNIYIGVINLIGRVFMDIVDCPFEKAKEEIEKIKKKTSIIIVDMHAEATSEKVAMGWFLDGRVSAVLGTHTHIQTADEKILTNGTAYITDCGMTGPYNSVIGRKKENIIFSFLKHIPIKFEVAREGIEMHGVVIDINKEDGKAFNIERIQKKI